MAKANLRDKIKFKIDKDPTIQWMAILILGGLCSGVIIDKKYRPRVSYRENYVKITQGLSNRNFFSYTAYENGRESFEGASKNIYTHFEDKDGDGQIDEIYILLKNYKNGKRIILKNEEMDFCGDWYDMGNAEIKNKRERFKKKIPFSKILKKALDNP